MPHRATRPGLRCVLLPPSLVLRLPNISTVHTQTHTYARTRTHWPRRRPFYSEWGQAPWISCLAPDFFPPYVGQPLFFCTHLNSSLPQVCFLLEPKKKLERKPLPLSSSRETKTNLMEKKKLKFFFYFLFFFFFSNSRHNVYQYSNLSVCLHSQVQCANIASHKLLDCLLVRHSLQLTSLVCTLTLLREVSVLVARATAKSKTVINNEQN